MAYDGANLWLVSQSGGNVIKVRGSDGQILGAFPVGSAPAGVAFDGANVWVTGYFGFGFNVSKL